MLGCIAMSFQWLLPYLHGNWWIPWCFPDIPDIPAHRLRTRWGCVALKNKHGTSAIQLLFACDESGDDEQIRLWPHDIHV
ncbi:hypothetical protein JB92DRAFT_2908645 [Gautieria morchelliformis]|nr:hypothetical protein JB92DRAFT_2908645 [Gautieria morchelliformis]